jgi:hypothetical protein
VKCKLQQRKRIVDENDSYQNIRQALTLTEQMIGSNRTLISNKEKQIFYKAGQELAQIVLEQPSYLEGLTLLKSLADGEGDETKKMAAFKGPLGLVARVTSAVYFTNQKATDYAFIGSAIFTKSGNIAQ